MIRADLIAAASAAADAATRARDPRHATTTGHVVAAALPVIVGAVTDELRRTHRPVHLIFSWRDGLHAEDPCPTCNGKAGEWECGCWADCDRQIFCAECSGINDPPGAIRPIHVEYPCPTRSLLDALDAEAGRNEGETNG